MDNLGYIRKLYNDVESCVPNLKSTLKGTNCNLWMSSHPDFKRENSGRIDSDYFTKIR